MILFTCTIASFVAQKGAKNIALLEAANNATDDEENEEEEKILIPINNLDTTDELINLGVTVKSKKNKDEDTIFDHLTFESGIFLGMVIGMVMTLVIVVIMIKLF